MQHSTVPAFLAALVAAVAAAAPADVLVLDGPPTTDLPDRYIAVGMTDEGSAIDGFQETEAGGLRNETYDVDCQLSYAGGDTDMAAARLQAAALLTIVETALLAAPTAAGTVGRAELTDFAWTQDQADSGAIVTVDFTVHVDLNRG